jgi:hypothetical protein
MAIFRDSGARRVCSHAPAQNFPAAKHEEVLALLDALSPIKPVEVRAKYGLHFYDAPRTGAHEFRLRQRCDGARRRGSGNGNGRECKILNMGGAPEPTGYTAQHSIFAFYSLQNLNSPAHSSAAMFAQSPC